MAAAKSYIVGRSSSCLRKYRILFVFGITVLCIQVYLAHSFFGLDNVNRRYGKFSSNQGNQLEENGGLPKRSRQLKLPPDKQTNKSLQLHRNRTTGLVLDSKTSNFTAACEVTGREAVSAVTRAQSQTCKEHIVNVTCLNQQGLLYPEKIQSLCSHSPGFKDKPVSLGCFQDNKTSRVLSGYYHVFKGNNSPERCAFLCLQSGYPYAGTEYSIECFCGMQEPSQVKHLPDSSCNMKCSGNSKELCGGYLTINVYWTGIQKFKAQEARNSSSKIEHSETARIAYLLTVNGRASRQIKRLISILYHPLHLFYIHVDARQDYLYREMLKIEKSCKSNNIKVAKGKGMRQASIWGGASLLTTFLKSAREMLAHQKQWDFLVNLSESDFPVKTNERLTEFLSWNKGMNFVKSHGREVQRFIAKQGLDKTFVECEARMWRVGDRKLPNGIQIDGGSDWVALSRDFVEYVASPTPDALVSDLLRVFRYTLLPAESFFHTVLRNSRFCNSYVDNNLHVTNWKRKLGCKCQYKAVVDWCGCSPNDFKLEDFSRIRNTAEKSLFFARKFEPMIDQRIVDRLEEWLYPERANRSIDGKGYDSYWQSLYHEADLSPVPDDALLTVATSLARLTFYRLAFYPVFRHFRKILEVRVIESTAYFRENQFAGILVLAEDHTGFRLEALIRPRHDISTNRVWLGKIRSLYVNTDYDQKEQTFRNMMFSIGPFSKPVLSYEFESGVLIPQNFTVLWIDPNGKLADVNHVHIEEMALIGHVKAQLSEHLVTGTWNVLLVTDSSVAAKIKFLVTPLSFWKNRKIEEEKIKEVNEISEDSYRHISEETVKKWSAFTKLPSQQQKSTTDTSPNLHRRIDAIVEEHYEIDKICEASARKIAYLSIQQCVDTTWSSLSPDLKADIRNLCDN